MMRRLFLAFAALLAVAGCSGKPSETEQEQGLKVAAVGFIETTDPHRAATVPERILAGEMHMGLVTVDSTGQIVPGLAESWWVSEDGLSYIFRLRSVQWPDGKQLTPDDVVQSFRRMLSPRTRHPLASWLARIRNGDAVLQGRLRPQELGVRALTDTVVEISLEEPRPAFLALLADPSVAIVREVRTQGRTSLLGLGPYQLESHTDQHLVLTASPAPAAGKGPVYTRVEFTAVSDPLESVQRFRNREADVVTGGSIGGLSEVKKFQTPAIARFEPIYGVYGYVAQTRTGPLADVRLRRALAMVIDRHALTKELFDLPGMAAVESLVPPGFASYGEPALPGWAAWPLDQRLTEARRLVIEAGYGPDKPLQLSVLLPPAREHQQILTAVAAAWKELGVEVTTKIAEPRDYQKATADGGFDLALRPLSISQDQPQVFLAPFTCEAADNFGGFCIPEADRLLADAGLADAPGVRIGLMKEAEQLMVEEAPLIPLFTPVRWSLLREGIGGWVDNPLGRHPLSSLTPQAARKAARRQ